MTAARGGAQTAPADGIMLGDVNFTATLRVREYVWNWFQPTAPYQNQYAYSGDLLRLNFAEKRGALDLDAEIAVPFMLDLPNDATAPAPQGALGLGSNYFTANASHPYTAVAFPKQLYGRYHFNETQTLQTGRFEFNDATELAPKKATLATLKRDRLSARLIGTFAFSDVGRSFDGFHSSWTQPGSADFTVIAATPTRGVFQTDGWGWNRIGFGYAAFTKDWGHGNHAADTRFFAIDYDDFRHILKTDNRPTAVRKGDTENIHIQTWGAHSLHALTTSAGTLDALGWGVFQTGRYSAGAQAVASRRLHDGLGRWQPQRQQARDVFPDPADATDLCDVPVL
jgi:hypothetical protein